MPLRLDLGAGKVSPPGFQPLGYAHGSEIFPLPFPDGSVDEIRASHCLEHFPTSQVDEVLAEWVRVLRPGGVLRVAVPDFAEVAKRYADGVNQPTEGYILGGQVDASDFHRSLFDADRLKTALSRAGLCLFRPWKSELDDCASLPISLNLQGTKPYRNEIKVAAAMSVPRLGFMDFFFCAMQALVPLNIKVSRMSGAFWGQCLTRCIESVIETDKPDVVLTLDYDTIFTKSHVTTLIQLMACSPDADAIAPIQASRSLATPMFSIAGEDGKNATKVQSSVFKPDLTPVRTAHFGLTLIDAKKLSALPRPWFHSVPDSDGRWENGRTDEDINFWRKWSDAGNKLYLANHVAVGHAEVMVRWPGRDLQAFHRPMSEFNEKGPPEETWR